MINPNTAGKQRNQIIRAIVVALRALMSQTEQNEETLDLVAFLAIGLEDVYKSIELSVAPWEKRGYWLKADRYRLEWEWTGRLAEELSDAIKNNDWGNIARIAAEIGEKVQKIQVSTRHRIGTPWIGSWELYKPRIA